MRAAPFGAGRRLSRVWVRSAVAHRIGLVSCHYQAPTLREASSLLSQEMTSKNLQTILVARRNNQRPSGMW